MLPVRKIRVVQLGVGGVGRTLVQQILSTRDHLLSRRGLRLDYLGLCDRTGYVLGEQPLSDTVLKQIVAAKAEGRSLRTVVSGKTLQNADENACLSWLQAEDAGTVIVVDVTAAQGMGAMLLQTVRRGHGVVLANKRPLAETFGTFQELVGSGRVRYEATVAAGLPVIYTTRYLADTGDDIVSIEGCLSGTMGYLCAKMEEGTPFSTALVEAKRMGYTEPDPREDLGGVDVARKALILARTLGWDLELADVAVEPQYPPQWDQLPVSEFLQTMPQLDEAFAARVVEARARREVLRYVAGVKDGKCWVGFKSIPEGSLLGSLRGTDNIVAIHSTRYQRPLIISGAGAGLEVTAAGVLQDIIELAMTLED